MTEAPEEKFLAHNGGLPTGNYPKADLVRYVRGDIHEAAVAAARKDGLLKAAQIAEADEVNDWTDGVPRGGMIAEAIREAASK